MFFNRQIRRFAGGTLIGSLPVIPQPKPPPVALRKSASATIVIVAVLVAVSAAFGGNFVALRVVVHALPPFSLQAIRFLVAGIVLYAYASSRKAHAKPTLRQWRTAFIGGGLLLFGGQGAISWSEQYVSAGIAALMCATIPLWVTIIGAVFLRARVRPLGLLGIICGFVGLLPIVLPHVTGSSGLAVFAVLLFATISWSVGTVLGARVRVHDDALMATAMQLLSGGTLLLLAAFVSREPSRIVWSAITPAAVWGMAYLILFGSIVGYAGYVWLLKNAPPNIAATFAYLAPIVTLLFGCLIHEETVSPTTIGGALVILVGVALVVANRNGSSTHTTHATDAGPQSTRRSHHFSRREDPVGPELRDGAAPTDKRVSLRRMRPLAACCEREPAPYQR